MEPPLRPSVVRPRYRSASSKRRLHVKGVFAEADDPEASEGEKLARLAGALTSNLLAHAAALLA